MLNIKTFFNGSIKLINSQLFKDSRGYFTESYNYNFFLEKILMFQINLFRIIYLFLEKKIRSGNAFTIAAFFPVKIS